ncbi:MAG: rhodanese-like domain-containing protein [Saprospiraceae bacterium]|nr:rhodanese-like domain-containing protein [Saprospiraceae bacterium]
MMQLKRFSPREAYAAYVLGGVMIDVREPEAVAEKTVDINHLVTLPMSEFTNRFNELPHNRPLVLVSRVGNTSNTAAKILLDNGYADVAIVDGGILAWEDEGLPLRHSA